MMGKSRHILFEVLDGTKSDGKLYIDLSTYLNDGRLDPGESVTTRLYFINPNRLRFTFEPSVRGVILL